MIFKVKNYHYFLLPNAIPTSYKDTKLWWNSSPLEKLSVYLIYAGSRINYISRLKLCLLKLILWHHQLLHASRLNNIARAFTNKEAIIQPLIFRQLICNT